MTADPHIRLLRQGEADECERIMSRLPHWFGIPSAISDYRRAMAYLSVKTLGPSRPDAHYAGTRKFYEAMGFLPIEETSLWGESNPCLIMVKHLACGKAQGSTG